MAEAAAALYAVETAVEGAVIGGLAVGRATVPLHVKFHKIKSPSPSLARRNHSLNIVKNRAYIFGGELEHGLSDVEMQCITLPTDLAFKDLDIDYQEIKSEAAPSRPLAPYSDEEEDKAPTSEPNQVPTARAAHASTAVGNNIYMFGGRSSGGSLLDENGTVHAFSALTNQWTTLAPEQTRCSQGVPPPRVQGSLTSTPHPRASNVSMDLNTDTEHNAGTLFLHSGYSSSSSNSSLRDVWTFDISSRVWSKWGDILAPAPEETAGEGRLLCYGSRLWRVGDGFGSMQYCDIGRDKADNAWGNADTELGVSPKSGQWEKLSFEDNKKPAMEESKEGPVERQENPHPTDKADLLPTPRRSAVFLPITTGAGREYLIYALGSDAPASLLQDDVWSFQIASEAKSLAKAKDKIRGVFGSQSGENQWAKCEVVQATKEDGELPRPAVEGFAADVWTDFGGGNVVLWGGKAADGSVRNEGWVMSIE